MKVEESWTNSNFQCLNYQVLHITASWYIKKMACHKFIDKLLQSPRLSSQMQSLLRIPPSQLPWMQCLQRASTLYNNLPNKICMTILILILLLVNSYNNSVNLKACYRLPKNQSNFLLTYLQYTLWPCLFKWK